MVVKKGLILILVALAVNCSSSTRCKEPTSSQCDKNMDYSGSGSGELTPTSMCISYQEAVFKECVSYFPEGNHHIFNYGADFKHIQSVLQNVTNILSSRVSSNYCKDTIFSYICNYFYPGCNTSLEIPVGVCREDCLKSVREECVQTYQNLANVTDIFPFESPCENTLGFINRFGFNFTTHNNDCITLSDVIEETTSASSTTTSFEESTSTRFVLTTDSTVESLGMWVIPVATAGPLLLVIIILVFCIVIVCCYQRRKERPQASNPLELQVPTYVRENNEYSDYQLQESFTNPMVQEQEELPLFQFLSEDVTRFGSSLNLKEVLVPFNQLCFIEEIAHGAFGRVYRGLFARSVGPLGRVQRGEWIEVAIKTIKDIQVEDSYNNIRDFIEESALMHSFDHPHVLGLVGISLDQNSSPYLILPFMENGDLRSFLKNKREIATKSTDTGYPEGLQYDMLVRICREIAEGMEYLASKKLVHRDLAARNCMVDGNISIKVADFGLTRDIYESDYYIKRINTKIPIKWMSPESLHDRVSNERTDVWAYGVTCWEIFSLGRIPYPTITNHEMLDYIERGNKLKQPALCSDEMYELMRKCWQHYPGDRPAFSEIVEMFNCYIIPETCTPTIGKAGYKVHVKGGTGEESLLSSIVSELKHTPAHSFERGLDEIDSENLSESSQQSLPCTSEIPQDTYMSLGTSFYVEMNPIFEGLVSPVSENVSSYPYEDTEEVAATRGIPPIEPSLRTGKQHYFGGASSYGNSYY